MVKGACIIDMVKGAYIIDMVKGACDSTYLKGRQIHCHHHFCFYDLSWGKTGD